MFTGIIQAIGTVVAVDEAGGDRRLSLEVAELALDRIAIGDSVAVSGACLTVTDETENGFAADVSGETLARTTLGALTAGDRVNLETALVAGDPLGGHLVSGHVDGIGRIVDIDGEARSWRFIVAADDALAPFWAEKGSVCVDGISLTVNEVDGARFGVNIVPQTLARTTLADRQVGEAVNLEIDLIARYLARLIESR